MAGPTFPRVAHETYPNPPLRAMLGQVQFPPVLRLVKGVDAVADLQDEIRSQFPGFSQESQIQITLGPSPETAPALAYRFTSRDNRWSALLSPAALTLEAMAGGRYSSYQDFAKLFKVLWTAVIRHFSPSAISRQGLRYVDHIEGEHSPAEWAELVNPALLQTLIGTPLNEDLERSISELVFSWPPGRQVVFRHGIVQAGPQNAKGYLLDFDSSHSEELAGDDIETLMARFDESHELLYAFFRWCVTDKALEEFKHDTA